MKVDINVLPVQEDENGPIEKIEKAGGKKAGKKAAKKASKKRSLPPLDIEPEVSQGD